MINKHPLFQIIMDVIPNPMILTNGIELVGCNKNFLDFFNYKDLGHFKQFNDSVSNLFIEHDEYFSLSSINKNVLWTDYIYHNNFNTDNKLVICQVSPRCTISKAIS